MAWREQVAREKRAAFADEEYWGRPVPGFGDPEPRILVVGLAPAAHGANRTGRVFTGDRSGDWLFASLHRVGLAALPTSHHRHDGQRLLGTRLVSAVRCAPPENKPTPWERDTCAPWLDRELALLLPAVRVVLALGAFGWAGALTALARADVDVPRPRPRFGHGVEVTLDRPILDRPGLDRPGLDRLGLDRLGQAGTLTLLGCYHPSPHNTVTGRLTAAMTDEVLARARTIARLGPVTTWAPNSVS